MYEPEQRLRFRFPVYGTTVPVDHGEAMYAALCKVSPQLHELNGLAISPICGGLFTGERLQLTRQSCLYIQAPQEKTAAIVGLSARTVSLRGEVARLGPVHLSLIQPSSMLQARFVTVKNASEPEQLHEQLKKALEVMNCQSADIDVLRRRVMTIHGKKVIGFGVTIRNLPEELSINIQVEGLGGRRRFSGGVFLPVSVTEVGDIDDG